MATYSKTQGTSVLSLQSVASGAVLISSAIDVSTVMAASIFIHFGRRAATALTVGCIIRIEASSKSSGDGHWYPLFIYTTDIAAASDEAVSGTVSSGTTLPRYALPQTMAVFAFTLPPAVCTVAPLASCSTLVTVERS